jgi:hypothetical protein
VRNTRSHRNRCFGHGDLVIPLITITELFLTLGRRLIPVASTTAATDNLEDYLAGEDPLEIHTFEVEYLGESVDVSLRWKDEPTANNINTVATYLPVAGLLLYGFLVKSYVKNFTTSSAAIDLIQILKAGAPIDNEAIIAANEALGLASNDYEAAGIPEFLKKMSALEDFDMGSNRGRYGDILRTLSASELEHYNELDMIAQSVMSWRDAWADYQAASLSGDWTEWNKVADKFLRPRYNNVGDEYVIRGILRADILEWQTAFEAEAAILSRSNLGLKLATVRGRLLLSVGKVLTMLGAVDIGLLLGTGVLAIMYDEETELRLINATLEPLFDPIKKELGLAYPSGSFAEYYGLSLPLDITTIALMMVFKEEGAEWLSETIDIPIDNFREALLIALLPLTDYMEIVIGEVTQIVDVELDWIKIRDDILFNSFYNNGLSENIFVAMELFLGAFAIKTFANTYILGSLK